MVHEAYVSVVCPGLYFNFRVGYKPFGDPFAQCNGMWLDMAATADQKTLFVKPVLNSFFIFAGFCETVARWRGKHGTPELFSFFEI
jgi:hypothetical protein